MIKFLFLLLLLIPSECFAITISASINWEFQETASSVNNGGGFDYANPNFDATLSATGGTGNTCTVSSANYSFVSGDIGNWVYIQSGSNWLPGWYKIASISGTSAVLNSAIGQVVVNNNVNGWTSSNPNSYTTNIVSGCASTATPSSGVWGLDYSQSTSPLKTDSTLASVTGTTVPSTVTDTGLSFGVNTIGNIIHVTAGTSWTAGLYEVVSVSTGTATLDRAVGVSAVLTSGTYSIGGAWPAGAMLTAFLAATTGGLVGGNIVWVKSNATPYTTSTTATGSGTNCTPTLSCWIMGYNNTHGDNPTGSNRPSFSISTATFTFAQYQGFENFIITGSAANVVQGGAGAVFINDKVTNTSVTVGRSAMNDGIDSLIMNCEIISQNGTGLNNTQANNRLLGNYFHDSNIGYMSSTTTDIVLNNIFESNTTDDINFTVATVAVDYIQNNTFYGTDSPTGTSILINSGSAPGWFFNNIFYGKSVAISGTTTLQNANILDYNDFFNNTTNYTLMVAGDHDTFIDPQFTSHGQITGTTATSSASVLTDSGKTFTSALIGQYLHVVSGTGATAGVYLINAQTSTTLTVNNAIGTDSTGDLTYYITNNHNYTPTATGLNGFPGTFPGMSINGNNVQGSIQSAASVSSGSGFFIQ